MYTPPWRTRRLALCIVAVAVLLAVASQPVQAEGTTNEAAAASAALADSAASLALNKPIKATVAASSPFRPAASPSLPSAVAAVRQRKPLPPFKLAAAAGSAAPSKPNAPTPATGNSKPSSVPFSRLQSTVRPPTVAAGSAAPALATSSAGSPRQPVKATVVQDLVARAVGGTKPATANFSAKTTLGANGHGRAPAAAPPAAAGPRISPTLLARVQETPATQQPPTSAAGTPPSSRAGAVAVADAQERQAAMAAVAAAQRDPIAAAVSAGALDDAPPPLARLPDEQPTTLLTPVPAASEARSNESKQSLGASVSAPATRVPVPAAAAPVATSPSTPPPANVTKRPAAVFKDGKILPAAAAAAAASAAASKPKLSVREAEEEAELEAALAEFEAANPSEATSTESVANVRDKVMANRQKMKERAGQPLHSEFAPRAASASSSDSSDKTRSRTGLDTSHAAGDLDVLRSLTQPHSSVGDQVARVSSAWLPAHGALIFILIFSVMCVRRVVSLCRGSRSSSTASDNSWRAKVAYALQALSTFIWDKKEPGLDSPIGNERTRDLAALSFVDGQSRMRRGVKAGTGTLSSKTHQESSPSSGGGGGGGGGDIELQSMTSSLASLHIPKMIYFSHDDDSHESQATPQSVLTPQLLQLLLPYLPSSSHIQDLKCMYQLSACGASLSDLYRRCGKVQDSLTIIQDSGGAVFGCYVSSAWRVHESYYGAGSCFVFTLAPSFHVYPASSVPGSSNSFFQLATPQALALGGGDHFAIWIDDALRKGISKHCNTFASPSLSSQEEFRCNGHTHAQAMHTMLGSHAVSLTRSLLSVGALLFAELEVWSFVDGQW